jgi:hypothetical protein
MYIWDSSSMNNSYVDQKYNQSRDKASDISLYICNHSVKIQ